MTVGVVIIGRNEGERLVNCLNSVRALSTATVYVDSGSTDGSASAAARFDASIVNLDMAQPFTAARARNEGFARLKSIRPDTRYVQFLDGDCELVPGWIESATKFLADRGEVAVVCGRRRERFPDASFYNRVCDIEWNTPPGEATACGGDSLVRVEAFEAAGGFRSDLRAGEEPELCVRLRERGWKIWRLDVEMTRHDADIRRLGQWWRRSVRSGYGCAEVSTLHRQSPYGIYGKEVMRAVFWAGAVPLVILSLAVIHPAALLAAFVYPLQTVRIAWRRGAASIESWRYASLMTLGKFAELQGVVRFHWHRWRGKRAELADYKQLG